jgi:hypothetical protein
MYRNSVSGWPCSEPESKSGPSVLNQEYYDSVGTFCKGKVKVKVVPLLN